MKTVQLQRKVWHILVWMGIFCPMILNAQNFDDSGALDPVINADNDDVVFFTSVRSEGTGDIDAQFSLKSSATTAAGWDQFASITRFIDGQVIDARNSDTYTSVETLSYDFNEAYYIWTVMHFASKTYDVYVKPVSGETTYTIAEDYGWRSGGDLNVSSIDQWTASNNNQNSRIIVGTAEYVESVGDVPTSVSDATLSDLSLDVGALSPDFDPSTTSYTASIPSSVSEFTITATPVSRGAYITGDSTITVDEAGGSIDVVVTSDDSTATTTYSVSYTVASGDDADATLSALTSDVGTLYPDFSPNKFKYVLSVPGGTSTINLAATTNIGEATVVGDGAIDVASLTGPQKIVVTARDGTTKLTYTVNVSVLTLKHSYTFEDGTANDVVGGVDGQVFGNAEIENGSLTIDADGEHLSFSGADLALNTYSSISVESFITAGDGVNNAYHMLWYFGGANGANAFWAQLVRADGSDGTRVEASGGGTVSQVDLPGVEAEVDDGIGHHVVVTLTSDSLIYYLDGDKLGAVAAVPQNISGIVGDLAYLGESGWPDPAWMGTFHEFNIYEGVLLPSEIKRRTGEFFSDASLGGIELSKGELDPAFDTETTSYNVTLPSGTASVNVTPIPKSPNATVIGGGEITDFSSPTEIKIDAFDGSNSMTYTINWTVLDAAADATLAELSPDMGELIPAFNPAITAYTLQLPYGTETVNFTTVTSAEGATLSGDEPLDVTSGSGTYEVIVTSSDESATTTYSVEASVDEFTISAMTIEGLDFGGAVVAGTFDQTFNEENTDYTVSFGSAVEKIYLASVETNDPNVFVEAPDTIYATGSTYQFPVVVTSADLVHSTTFNITINVAAGVYITSEGMFDPALTGTDHIVYSRIDIDDNGVAVDALFGIGDGIVRDWGKTSGGIRFNEGITLLQLRNGEVYEPDTALVSSGIPVLYDTTYHCWMKISPADTTYSVYAKLEGMDEIAPIGEDAGFRFLTNKIDHWLAMSATGSNQGLNVRRVEVVESIGDMPTMGTDATLSDIELSAGALGTAFGPDVTNYDVVLPFGTESVMVTGVTTDRWARVTGDGEILLDGDSTITLLVQAEDTTVSKEYVLNFSLDAETTDATLASLSADIGELSPTFRPDITTYELNVPYGTTTVNLSAEANVADATVSGDGAIDVSAGGTITVDVVVTATDATTIKTYTISITVEGVSSDATLTYLRASVGTFSADFDPAVSSYDLMVPFGTETVKITYLPSNDYASVSITDNGVVSVTYGVTTTVDVEVTAQDGSTNTYTIGIDMEDPSSDASLASLEVEADGAELSPAFDPATLAYTLEVPYGNTEVMVAATANHHGASVAGDGVVDVSSGNTTATIVVTAEDESTQSYTIDITVLPASTDATLKSLTVDGATLEPAFDPSVLEYVAVVPLGTTTATVLASTNFYRATLAGAGAVDVVSGSGEANVVVTAEDGTTKNTYTISIYVGSKPDEPDDVLSADELLKTMKMYPNPTSDYLMIELESGAYQGAQVSILDVNGKIYLSKKVNAQMFLLDVSILHGGIYLMRIESHESQETKRFIKLD